MFILRVLLFSPQKRLEWKTTYMYTTPSELLQNSAEIVETEAPPPPPPPLAHIDIVGLAHSPQYYMMAVMMFALLNI